LKLKVTLRKVSEDPSKYLFIFIYLFLADWPIL